MRLTAFRTFIAAPSRFEQDLLINWLQITTEKRRCIQRLQRRSYSKRRLSTTLQMLPRRLHLAETAADLGVQYRSQ